MNAIILAAGFGSRLGDLTKNTPKCLIEVAGKPMLQHVIERLRAAGTKELVINTHYLADQVSAFVKSLSYEDLQIKISHEEVILGTGGGIKQASELFSNFQDTFIYNADTLSNLDLNFLAQQHKKNQALVSIACQDTYVPRHLIFDAQDQLVGWANDTAMNKSLIPGAQAAKQGHYLCVQIISAGILKYFSDYVGEFSIFEPYLKAAAVGETIKAVWFNELSWHDIGTPQDLAEARKENS